MKKLFVAWWMACLAGCTVVAQGAGLRPESVEWFKRELPAMSMPVLGVVALHGLPVCCVPQEFERNRAQYQREIAIVQKRQSSAVRAQQCALVADMFAAQAAMCDAVCASSRLDLAVAGPAWDAWRQQLNRFFDVALSQTQRDNTTPLLAHDMVCLQAFANAGIDAFRARCVVSPSEHVLADLKNVLPLVREVSLLGAYACDYPAMDQLDKALGDAGITMGVGGLFSVKPETVDKIDLCALSAWGHRFDDRMQLGVNQLMAGQGSCKRNCKCLKCCDTLQKCLIACQELTRQCDSVQKVLADACQSAAQVCGVAEQADTMAAIPTSQAWRDLNANVLQLCQWFEKFDAQVHLSDVPLSINYSKRFFDVINLLTRTTETALGEPDAECLKPLMHAYAQATRQTLLCAQYMFAYPRMSELARLCVDFAKKCGAFERPSREITYCCCQSNSECCFCG